MFSPISETWVPDFAGDLYGRRVTVFLEGFIRSPMVFKDESELAHDIKLCVEKAIEVFKNSLSLYENLYNDLRNAFSVPE
jgi:FAD synthase